MKKILLIFLIAILSLQCNKIQIEVLATEPTTINRFPTLTASIDTSKVPLRLTDLKINVDIVGNTVRTTMDMRFYNDMDRVLEGELNFPLENEQVVSRFAMEINNQLREGVVVEKEKGRRAFETIVRNQVDPGLLEMTKGNNFRARVYPIPSKGYKRIVIGYEEELSASATGWFHHITTGLREQVDNFGLQVTVNKHNATPKIKSDSIKELRFKRVNEGYQTDFEAKNFTPNKTATVTIPANKKSKPIVLTQHTGDGTYFYISTKTNPVQQDQQLPNAITLFWDVSTSAQQKDIDAELDALELYFKKIKDATITLVAFSNTVHSETTFSIINGNLNKLKTAIKNLQYDGGTQLGTLDLKNYDSDLFILSSDGLTTLGNSDLKLTNTPIIVFNSNASADEAYLNFVAQGTGGKYIDFREKSMDDIQLQLFNNTYQFISAAYDGQKIRETYPNVATPVDYQFSMGGILIDKSATITLKFGIGKKVMEERTITIKRPSDINLNDAARLWAKKKVTQLNMQSKKYEDEITDLGVQHSLVTPYTSLIVLETVEDYVRYEIEPPTDLQEEYYRLLSIKTEDKTAKKKAQEKALANQLNAQKRWWEKKYKVTNSNETVEWASDSVNLELPDDIEIESPRTATPPPPPPVIEEVPEEVAAEAIESASEEVAEEAESEDETFNWRPQNSAPSSPSVPNAPRANYERGTPLNYTDESIPVTRNEANIEDDEDGFSSAPPEEKKSSVELAKWAADTLYASKLNAVAKEERFATYLKLKAEQPNSATFFLDIGEYFLNQGDKATALRVLSNIAEMDLENRELLKILANKLRQLKEYDLAILVYQEIIRIKGEEPQSHRDLALTYIEIGKYQEALDLLYKVVSKDWEENEDRFNGIKIVALTELNNLVALHKDKLDISKIPKKWIQNFPVDVRIVLNWSSDNTDVDLWVTDPNGEKGFYSNKLTTIGGRFTFDMTRGYGPEEFMLKNAIEGEYLIEADFYGDTRQKVAGNVTMDVQFFTNYGRPNQKVEEITLTLSGVKEVVRLGKVRFEK